MVRLLVLLTPLLCLGRRSASELAHDFRDDQDGRVLAEVRARVEGLKLTVEVRAYGPRVEPPLGFEGRGGENVQAARELARGIAAGTLRVETPAAVREALRPSGSGAFALRRYDAGRKAIVDATSEVLPRSVRYEAELTPTSARRRFWTEFRAGGALRLVLHGAIHGARAQLLRFEPERHRLQDDLEQLIRQLGDESAERRVEAQRKIAVRGPAALPALRMFEDDADPERRERVRDLVRRLRNDEALGKLDRPDPESRGRAFAEFGTFAGKDPLAYAVAHPDPRFLPILTDIILYELNGARRDEAYLALLGVGPPQIYPALLWALPTPVGHLAAKVEGSLAKMGDLTVLHELEKLEKAGMAEAKPVIAAIRARFPDGKPAPPVDWKPIDREAFILAVTKGKTAADRVRAIRAVITGIGWSTSARGAVRAALSDAEEEVRFRAAEAFTYIAGEEAVAALAATLAGDAEALRVRQMAAVALSRAGGRAAHDALVSALEAGPGELRSTAAGAIADTGERILLPHLEKREMEEKDPNVRAALREAIHRLARRVK